MRFYPVQNYSEVVDIFQNILYSFILRLMPQVSKKYKLKRKNKTKRLRNIKKKSYKKKNSYKKKTIKRRIQKGGVKQIVAFQIYDDGSIITDKQATETVINKFKKYDEFLKYLNDHLEDTLYALETIKRGKQLLLTHNIYVVQRNREIHDLQEELKLVRDKLNPLESEMVSLSKDTDKEQIKRLLTQIIAIKQESKMQEKEKRIETLIKEVETVNNDKNTNERTIRIFEVDLEKKNKERKKFLDELEIITDVELNSKYYKYYLNALLNYVYGNVIFFGNIVLSFDLTGVEQEQLEYLATPKTRKEVKTILENYKIQIYTKDLPPGLSETGFSIERVYDRFKKMAHAQITSQANETILMSSEDSRTQEKQREKNEEKDREAGELMSMSEEENRERARIAEEIRKLKEEEERIKLEEEKIRLEEERIKGEAVEKQKQEEKNRIQEEKRKNWEAKQKLIEQQTRLEEEQKTLQKNEREGMKKEDRLAKKVQKEVSRENDEVTKMTGEDSRGRQMREDEKEKLRIAFEQSIVKQLEEEESRRVVVSERESGEKVTGKLIQLSSLFGKKGSDAQQVVSVPVTVPVPTTLPVEILQYWSPIIEDVNVLISMKERVKAIVSEGSACPILQQTLVNYEGVSKNFKGTTQDISEIVCMVGVVMGFINKMLSQASYGSILLKGSASLLPYTKLPNQIQDLDYIILLNVEDPDNKKQKELAFQISNLVLWLLDSYKEPMSLINTFIPSPSVPQRPSSPLNLSDTENKQKFFNDTDNSLHKGSNVKITAVFNRSAKDIDKLYYQIADICYDIMVLDPQIKDMYLNGVTVTRLENNGLILYLGIEQHFTEMCYNILNNYLFNTVHENLYYLSKTKIRIRDVIIAIKVFIEKDEYFSNLLKGPSTPEIDYLIETYFLTKLYSTFQKYFDQRKTPIQVFSDSLTPIINDIFYNGTLPIDIIDGNLVYFRQSLIVQAPV